MRQSWGFLGVATPSFWAEGVVGVAGRVIGGRERVSENTIAAVWTSICSSSLICLVSVLSMTRRSWMTLRFNLRLIVSCFLTISKVTLLQRISIGFRSSYDSAIKISVLMLFWHFQLATSLAR